MPTIFMPMLPSTLTEDDVRKRFEEVNLGVIKSVEMEEHTRGYLSYRNFKVHYYSDEVVNDNKRWVILHFAGSLIM